MSKRKLVSLIFLCTILVTAGFLILFSRKHIQRDYTIVLSFITIIVISICCLLSAAKKYTYSLDLMFWVFSFFFFGIAPLLQYYANIYSWNLQPLDKEILTTNIYILIWICSYLLGHSITFITTHQYRNDSNQTVKYYVSKNRMTLLSIGCTVILVYNLVFVGFSNLFIVYSNSNSELNQMTSLLVNHGFHNFMMFSLVLAIVRSRDMNRYDLRFWIILICFIICCFPTGLIRNMMASFYAGLLIIISEKHGRNNRWLPIAIIVGLVIVFPAINIFRSANSLNAGSWTTMMLNSIQSTYTGGDYDAHQMIISIQRWVEKDGFSFGKQLLGALLFFVPRSVWPNKPYGTGRMAFVATNQFWFNNVSAPLIAEGYVNFGIIGIVIVGFMVGIIVNTLDKKYWRSLDIHERVRIIYPFSIFLFFFMLRGDLQSSWAYMFAQLLIGAILWKAVIKKRVTVNNH